MTSDSAAIESTARSAIARDGKATTSDILRAVNLLEDSFVVLDKDWRYTSVNPAAARCSGLSANEMLGSVIWDVSPTLRGSEFEHRCRRAMASQQRDQFEFPDAAGGSIEHRLYPSAERLTILSAPVIARKSSPALREEFAPDATLEKLRQCEERLRLALGTNALTVYEQDEHLRYVWLHPNYTEAIGKTDDELATPDDARVLREVKLQVLQTGVALRREVRVRFPDVTRYFDLLIEPRRDKQDRIVGIGGVALDITSRKMAETGLRGAVSALKENEQRKEDFLAMLAHELRNPLGPICNSVQVLRKLGPVAAKAERIYSIVERQVGHMVRLIDDLLDASRIARGKITLKKETLDLCELLRSVIEDHRSLFDANGVQLEWHLPASPVWMRCDRTRIAQVAANLLHNAQKFTNAGGKACVTLSVAGGHAIIGVQDNGIGIEPSLQGRLFEPFMQGSQNLDRNRGGLGLGLTLVQGLLALHGGSISVNSEGIGKGSEFVIKLPFENTDSQTGAATASHAAVKGRKVLLIEDNRDAAETLKMLLSLDGHDVVLAASGTEGIIAVDSFVPQVVICDIGLPGLNGYEVCRALRKIPALRSTYMIALTGYGQAEDQRCALDAGFNLHLTKPVDPARLEEVFKNLIV